jgi:hypothetical protein
MKKASILIIALFLLIACKKNNATSYYFKFQQGDSTYSLDSIFAIVDTTAGVYSTKIYSANPNGQTSVSIQLISLNGSVTGNYSSGYSTAFPQPYQLFRIVPFSSIWIDYPHLFSYTIDAAAPFTLTISNASKTAIGGSFSGQVTDSTTINGTFFISVDSI